MRAIGTTKSMTELAGGELCLMQRPPQLSGGGGLKEGATQNVYLILGSDLPLLSGVQVQMINSNDQFLGLNEETDHRILRQRRLERHLSRKQDRCNNKIIKKTKCTFVKIRSVPCIKRSIGEVKSWTFCLLPWKWGGGAKSQIHSSHRTLKINQKMLIGSVKVEQKLSLVHLCMCYYYISLHNNLHIYACVTTI